MTMKGKKILLTINKEPLKHWVVIILIVLAIVSLGNIVTFFYQNRQTISLATSVKPEAFTELYFENHTELPRLMAYPNQFTWYDNASTNLYSFSFTINNLENKPMNYPYEVYSFEHNKILIDQGKLFINPNESKTLTEQFTLSNNHSRTKVVVNLIEKNQQISFWIDKQSR